MTKPRKGEPAVGWTPDRPGRRASAPALVGEVLVGAQEYIAQRSGALMSHDEWRRIVGAKIASRSRLGGLYRGTLTIKVASSAWSNELSFLKADIVDRLAMAGYEVSGLRFRVDPEPFREARPKPGQRLAPAAPAPAGQLPPELEARLRNIDDPNLRAAIREAAAWSLGSPARAARPAGDRGSAAAAPRLRPRR